MPTKVKPVAKEQYFAIFNNLEDGEQFIHACSTKEQALQKLSTWACDAFEEDSDASVNDIECRIVYGVEIPVVVSVVVRAKE